MDDAFAVDGDTTRNIDLFLLIFLLVGSIHKHSQPQPLLNLADIGSSST